MKMDTIEQYVTLQAALLKEKAALEDRLVRVNQALSGKARSTALSRALGSVSRGRLTSLPSRRRRRARNEVSLREIVTRATSARSLTKKDIMAAVVKSGYTFTAKNPMNSLNVLLYKNGLFKRANGKFSPAK